MANSPTISPPLSIPRNQAISEQNQLPILNSDPQHTSHEHFKVDLEKTETRRRVCYTRKELLLLHKSPLVAPPEGMPHLKAWFGEFESTHATSKNKDVDNGVIQRGARFRQHDVDDNSREISLRPSYKSSFAQPSQMGNFRHQPFRDRERADPAERERERELREKENQEKLRTLSDRFDRDRLLSTTNILGAPISPLTTVRGKERDGAPHMSSQGSRLSTGNRRTTDLRETVKGDKKGRSGESEDWRRGDPSSRRDERGESSRRHRDSSRTREGDEDSHRGQTRRERERDDDSRKWRDDGKRDEREKERKDREVDNKPDRWSTREQREHPDVKRDRDLRDGWTITEEGRHRSSTTRRRDRRGADGEDEKDRAREKEKEKEPAWMDDYLPESSTSKGGILGGKGKDGEVDGIQAWKREQKEKERKDKEKVEGAEASESPSEEHKDSGMFGHLTTKSTTAQPVNELQQLVLMMKANESARHGSGSQENSPPTQPPTSAAVDAAPSQVPSRKSLATEPVVLNGRTDNARTPVGTSATLPEAKQWENQHSGLLSLDGGQQTPRQIKPPVTANPQPISNYSLTSLLAGEHLKTVDQSSSAHAPIGLPPAQSNGHAMTHFNTSQPTFAAQPSSALPSISAYPLAQRPSSRTQPSPHPEHLLSRIASSGSQPSDTQRSVFDQARTPSTPGGPFERTQTAFPPPLDRSRQPSLASSNDPRASPFPHNERNHGFSSPVSSNESVGPLRGNGSGYTNQNNMMSFDSSSNAPGSAPATYAPGKGSKFAKFWDGRTKEAAAAGHAQAAANVGLINGPVTGDAHRMQDLLAMLQQSSSQAKRAPQGPLTPNIPPFSQANPSPALPAFQSQQQQVQHLQQQLLQQQQQQHFGGHSAQESMYDSNRFVPDGMVPGLRPQRPRESIREGYPGEQVDDRLQFNVQRLPPQQQAFDQLHARPVPPLYSNQPPGGANRGPNFAPGPGGPAQFRNSTTLSPMAGNGGAGAVGLPPGLANLGARPPHDPHRHSGNMGLGIGTGIGMGIDRLGTGGLSNVGGANYGRGMPGPQQLPHNLAHLGGRPPVELNSNQFMGRPAPAGMGLNPNLGFGDGNLPPFGAYGANSGVSVLNSAALNSGRMAPASQLPNLQSPPHQYGHNNNLDFSVQPQPQHLHGGRGLGPVGQMGANGGMMHRGGGGGGGYNVGMQQMGPAQLHAQLQQHLPNQALNQPHNQPQVGHDLMALLMGGNLSGGGLGGGYGHRE